VLYLEENFKYLIKPKRKIMIIIAMIGSQKPERRIMIIIQRELNTTETTNTNILSLKPYTTNNTIQEFDSGENFHASIYNTIAYNITKIGNYSSPNLEFWLQKYS